MDAGLIERDPARDVRTRKTADATGAIPWTREDFATFRAHWAMDTMQRLAFEVMYQTCAAIGDACALGPPNVHDGWIIYRRRKSQSDAASPWLAPPPEWFEGTEDLKLCVELAPRHLTFRTTYSGAAKSPKAAAQWFSKACTSADLPGHSAHGIRKGRAAVFRENGATAEQRMAILGHETEAEAKKYSRSADLARIITGTKSSNSAGTSWNFS